MTPEFGISIAGTVLGAVSLAYAIVQGIRIRDVRRRTETDIWLGLRTVRSIIGKLEESELRNSQPVVAQVYGKAVELYRHLLKEAVLAEPVFNEETIALWKAAGKLGSSWQVAQARHFLPTNAIRSQTLVAAARERSESRSSDSE